MSTYSYNSNEKRPLPATQEPQICAAEPTNTSSSVTRRLMNELGNIGTVVDSKKSPGNFIDLQWLLDSKHMKLDRTMECIITQVRNILNQVQKLHVSDGKFLEIKVDKCLMSILIHAVFDRQILQSESNGEIEYTRQDASCYTPYGKAKASAWAQSNAITNGAFEIAKIKIIPNKAEASLLDISVEVAISHGPMATLYCRPVVDCGHDPMATIASRQHIIEHITPVPRYNNAYLHLQTD